MESKKYLKLKHFVETSEVLTQPAKKSLNQLLNDRGEFSTFCSYGVTEWHIQVIEALRMFNIIHTCEKFEGRWIVEIKDIDFVRGCHREISVSELNNLAYENSIGRAYGERFDIESSDLKGTARYEEGSIIIDFVQFYFDGNWYWL